MWLIPISDEYGRAHELPDGPLPAATMMQATCGKPVNPDFAESGEGAQRCKWCRTGRRGPSSRGAT